MARFYGQIYGKAKTKASRMGTKSSGLWGNLESEQGISLAFDFRVDREGNDKLTLRLTRLGQPAKHFAITLKEIEDY